jgi:hypothetical protein
MYQRFNITELRKTLEVLMNTYHRMQSPDESHHQLIYVGSFDFIVEGKIRKYGYVTCFRQSTQQWIVTCRCIDKTFGNSYNNFSNLEFEYKASDDDDKDIQITKFLG